MSSVYLPAEILDLIAEECDSESLHSFILVQKSWMWPARKRIWRSIGFRGVIRKEILKLIKKDRELGNYVKKLTLHYDNHKRKTIVTKQQFKEYLRYLPNLSDITIYDIVLSPLQNLAPARFSLKFTLPLLTSFAYIISKDDTMLDILETILYRAINLKKLSLTIDSLDSNYAPIRNCSTLNTLEIYNQSLINIFRSQSPLLPLSSLRRLVKFSYDQYGRLPLHPAQGLAELIRQTSTTLEHLDLTSDDHVFESIDIIHILADFNSLRELRILSPLTTPLDILQLLPKNLQLLDIPLNKAQLSYLQAHPRQEFNLKQLIFEELEYEEGEGEDWNMNMFRVLPAIEVIVYRYTRLEALDVLVSKWCLIAPKSLTRIVVQGIGNYYRTDEEAKEQENLRIQSFQEVGVVLHFEYM